MKDWKPKLDPDFELTSLALSVEDYYVVTRIDGVTSVEQLSQLTGFSEERVSEVLQKLADQSALTGDVPPKSSSSSGPPSAELDLSDEESDDVERREAESESQDEISLGDDEAEEAEENAVSDNLNLGNYRRLYETKLRPLDVDARQALAQNESGPTLCALCLDADPHVIRAVLENPRVSLDHARLIANHHRSPAGLDAIGGRVSFVRDSQVRKFLLRNQQATDVLVRKVVQALSLDQCFQLVLSRELTERAKRATRETLRSKYTEAQQEQRAALILKTEARCLNFLTGIPMGDKTVSILCRRPIPSLALAQNLARFAGLSPLLIRHLFTQQVVRTNVQVKKMLLSHPNCPTKLKREIL